MGLALSRVVAITTFITLLPGCRVLHYPSEWNRPSLASTAPPTGMMAPADGAVGPTRPSRAPDRAAAPKSEPMLAFARRLLGQGPPIVVKGRTFRYDCSGFAQAVYYSIGVDIMDLPPDRIRPGISGTEHIFYWVQDNGQVLKRNPLPGDLVFFHNTYDRDGDGRLDDRFTHIGIVDALLPSGTIEILHLGNSGIGRIHMNLERPNEYRDEETGELLNHKLRRQRRTDPQKTSYLSAQLFHAFGRPSLKGKTSSPILAETR